MAGTPKRLHTGAAQWWEIMDRRPVVRKIFVALIVLLLLGIIYFLFLPQKDLR